MTEEPRLPQEIRSFIQSYIPSAGSLEILLLLDQDRERPWTVDSIAVKLRSNYQMVKDFLLYFESKDLVIRENDLYQLNSKRPDFIWLIQKLREAFQTKPVSVMNEIYRVPNKPDSKIRLFADAFKIKKEK